MFKKLLKSKKETTSTSKTEKLNSNQLKNVIGGDGGLVTPAPDPVDSIRAKSHSNTSFTD